MRFDLYTSSDRATEARQRFMEEQALFYWAWTFVGSWVFAGAIAIALWLIFPEMFSAEFATDSDSVWSIVIGQLILGPMAAGVAGKTIFTIWLLVFFTAVIGSAFSIKFVALYQGLFFGAIFGAIAGAVVMGVMYGLDIPGVFNGGLVAGGLVALIVAGLGLLGAFVPEAR